MDAMENLYINIENGEAVNHPVLESNLIHLFGEIPSNYSPFIRVEKPTPREYGPYKKLVGDTPTYQLVDGVWQDVWPVVDMSDDEIIAKQNSVKQFFNNWFNYSNFSDWTFNTETCNYVPPIPMPTDDQNYMWQGSTGSWRVVPEKPNDGIIPESPEDDNHRFNLSSWTWEIPPKYPKDGNTYMLDQRNWVWVKYDPLNPTANT